MAAPNLVSPTTINGKSDIFKISTTNETSVLSNASSSGKALKVNSVFAANVSSNNNVYVDLYIFRSSVKYYLAYQVYVPYAASQVLVRKDTYVYLEEGDALYFKSDLANGADVIISYEEIS